MHEARKKKSGKIPPMVRRESRIFFYRERENLRSRGGKREEKDVRQESSSHSKSNK
jgi:hypothetical protein